MPDNSMLAPATERWTAIPHSANAGAWYVVDSSGFTIAAGLRPHHAALIATAPAMRELLVETLALRAPATSEHDAMRQKVRALLASLK